jgi:hypothetical protein
MTTAITNLESDKTAKINELIAALTAFDASKTTKLAEMTTAKIDKLAEMQADSDALLAQMDTDYNEKLLTLGEGDVVMESYDLEEVVTSQDISPALHQDILDVVDVSMDTLANKTVVTLTHQFADNTARDNYFTLHPTELVDKLFIKVGTAYQQRINTTWESASAVLVEMLTAQNQNLVDAGNYFTTKNTEAALQEIGYKQKTGNKAVYSNALQQVATGVAVNFKYTLDAPLVDIKLEGNSAQTVTTQGKNILPNNAVSKTMGGVTFTVNSDKTITAIGTRTGLAYIAMIGILGSNVTVLTLKAGVSYYATPYLPYQKPDGTYGNFGATGIIVPTADMNLSCVYWEISPSDVLPKTVSPIIAVSTTAVPYEQFVPNSPSVDYPAPITNVGDTAFDTVVSGKNILPKTTNTTLINNGITFTVNNDGSITTNGTATALAQFVLFGVWGSTNPIRKLLSGAYTLKGASASGATLYLINNTTTVFSSTNNADTKILASDTSITYAVIQVQNGTTVSNVTVYPQLELGSVATAYEAYKENKVTIPRILRSLPSGVKDTIEKINGVWNHVQRIDKYVVTANDIASLTTTNVNNDIVNINRTNMTGFANVTTDTVATRVMTDRSSPRNNLGFDTTDIVNKHSIAASVIYLFVAKGKYATLADAKTALTGMIVQYELATPVYTPLVTPVNLTSYPSITNIFTTSAVQPNIVTTVVADINTILADTYVKKVDETWITPTLINNWVAYDTARTPKYYKDANGIVHVKGMMKSGTVGSSAFILPVGYRPDALRMFTTNSTNVFGLLQVDNTGAVTALTNNTFVYIDVILFKAEV